MPSIIVLHTELASLSTLSMPYCVFSLTYPISAQSNISGSSFCWTVCCLKIVLSTLRQPACFHRALTIVCCVPLYYIVSQLTIGNRETTFVRSYHTVKNTVPSTPRPTARLPPVCPFVRPCHYILLCPS